jgi:hypothetical protein
MALELVWQLKAVARFLKEGAQKDALDYPPEFSFLLIKNREPQWLIAASPKI